MSGGRVTLAACTPQPWRNGGGLTRELLAWPAPSDWQVRVSVADVGADGPFSPFPGIDRWFAVVDGAGVVLALPDGDRALERGQAPLRFAGEAAPHCRLVAGRTRDLNLMVRRGAGAAAMHLAAPGSAVEGITRWRALYAAEAARLGRDGVAEALAPGTLAWTDGHTPTTWRLLEGTLAFWMTLQP